MGYFFPQATYKWPANFAFAFHERDLKVERHHEFPHIQPKKHVDHVVEVDCMIPVALEGNKIGKQQRYVRASVAMTRGSFQSTIGMKRSADTNQRKDFNDNTKPGWDNKKCGRMPCCDSSKSVAFIHFKATRDSCRHDLHRSPRVACRFLTYHR